MLRISRVRGGFQLQGPGGAVGVSPEDPAELGRTVLEMLDAPQPEIVTEPDADPDLEAAPAAAPFADGDPFVELQQKGIDWLNKNGDRLINDGLGFLRNISRDKKKPDDAKP